MTLYWKSYRKISVFLASHQMGYSPEVPVRGGLHEAAAPAEDGLFGEESAPPFFQSVLHGLKLGSQVLQLAHCASHLTQHCFCIR